MPAILLAEGRRYEPVKVSAETAKTVRFKVNADLTGHTVRWELLDRVAGARVTLQEASGLAVTDAGTEAAVSEFDVELADVDTVVSGPHLLLLSAEDGDGQPVDVPGGLVEVNVSGPNRTLTLGYFELNVSQAVQAKIAADKANAAAQLARAEALEAKALAVEARNEARDFKESALAHALNASSNASGIAQELIKVSVDDVYYSHDDLPPATGSGTTAWVSIGPAASPFSGTWTDTANTGDRTGWSHGLRFPSLGDDGLLNLP